jgi:hypothetical protein
MSLYGALRSALVSSWFLGRIKLFWICSTDLTNEASNSIGPLVLTKNQEHGSHVVVHELHSTEPHTPGWVVRTSILNIIHPICVSVVELAVDLIQLTLQSGDGDISANPGQMGWFPPGEFLSIWIFRHVLSGELYVISKTYM